MLLFPQEQRMIDRTLVVSVTEVRVCNTISMQSLPCTLHRVAVYCISIQSSPRSVSQYAATRCSVLTQCVAVCCSMSCFSTTPMQISPCSLYPTTLFSTEDPWSLDLEHSYIHVTIVVLSRHAHLTWPLTRHLWHGPHTSLVTQKLWIREIAHIWILDLVQVQLCCSVLLYVAVCCSVLQRAAHWKALELQKGKYLDSGCSVGPTRNNAEQGMIGSAIRTKSQCVAACCCLLPCFAV